MNGSLTLAATRPDDSRRERCRAQGLFSIVFSVTLSEKAAK